MTATALNHENVMLILKEFCATIEENLEIATEVLFFANDKLKMQCVNNCKMKNKAIAILILLIFKL